MNSEKMATPTSDTQQTSQDISEEARLEDKIDRDLIDSFPASDPPGWTMGGEEYFPKKENTGPQ